MTKDSAQNIKDEVINPFLVLGNAIKKARVNLCMSQAELSEITGVSIYTIRKIEHGGNFSMLDFCRLLPAVRLSLEVNSDIEIIENFDEWYAKNIRPNIGLDQKGGVFASLDPSFIKVNWSKSADGI